jgi:N-acetylmuramoyl-L-alanine amidase
MLLTTPGIRRTDGKSGFAANGVPLASFVRLVSLVFLGVFATAPLLAATAQEMYLAALAREQTVRAVLADDNATARVAADARAVVAAYREVVRLHPASGYSDNALWQAGSLSLDLFARFGEERDRTVGVRLLRLLTTEYPSSSRVRDVPAQLAGARPRVATITDIRRTVLPDAVRITIEFDGEVTFRDERIDSPSRVFVDLPATQAAATLRDRTVRFDVDNDIVRQIRIGRHPNDTTRVVLDAAGVAAYSVYPMYEPYRLIIDCVREPEPSATAEVNRVQAAPLRRAEVTTRSNDAAQGDGKAPVGLPAATSSAVPGPRPVLAAKPLVAVSTTPPPDPPATAPRAPLPTVPVPTSTTAPPRNLGGGYSMARQLGLSVSRIVIDPGHGGHDPGAIGKSINESELVLDIALRVEKLLEQVPGIEVFLTRRTDEFVPLEERTAIANRHGADLFLSIHANASTNPAAAGIETYFLNFASNMSAASVAARENAASGQSMGALPDFLKAIALNNKLDESRDFANAVQSAMIERLRRSNKAVKNLGVKQAPFVVLIGAAMPSVLAEISFVTNAQEARLLRGSAYRQRIAEALVNAIRKYQTSLKNVVKVAQE